MSWKNKCPVCEEKLIAIKTSLDLHDGKVILNDVESQYCPKCKEELYTPDQMKKIDKLTKGINIQQMSLRRKISESGRSLVIRIPQDIARSMHLTKNTEVEIRMKDSHEMIIETVR